MSEWKPIETAPKDGTEVELRNERAGPSYDCKGRFDGHWRIPWWFIYNTPQGPILDPHPTHWRDPRPM